MKDEPSMQNYYTGMDKEMIRLKHFDMRCIKHDRSNIKSGGTSSFYKK